MLSFFISAAYNKNRGMKYDIERTCVHYTADIVQIFQPQKNLFCDALDYARRDSLAFSEIAYTVHAVTKDLGHEALMTSMRTLDVERVVVRDVVPKTAMACRASSYLLEHPFLICPLVRPRLHISATFTC